MLAWHMKTQHEDWHFKHWKIRMVSIAQMSLSIGKPWALQRSDHAAGLTGTKGHGWSLRLVLSLVLVFASSCSSAKCV